MKLYYILAASPRRHILIVDHMDRRPPALAPSALANHLPCDIGLSPPFPNPHNRFTIIPSNICLEQVFCSPVVSYFKDFDKGGPLQLGIVFFMFSLVWIIITHSGNSLKYASHPSPVADNNTLGEFPEICKSSNTRRCWECFIFPRVLGLFFKKSAAILNFVRNSNIFFARVTFVIFRV